MKIKKIVLDYEPIKEEGIEDRIERVFNLIFSKTEEESKRKINSRRTSNVSLLTNH